MRNCAHNIRINGLYNNNKLLILNCLYYKIITEINIYRWEINSLLQM